MSVFDDEDTAAADAADRARGRNDVGATHIDQDSKTKLRAIVARIEDLEVSKKEISDDIKQVYTEAKGGGFDTKIIRQLVRRRKMDIATRDEQDTLLELYEGVFG